MCVLFDLILPSFCLLFLFTFVKYDNIHLGRTYSVFF